MADDIVLSIGASIERLKATLAEARREVRKAFEGEGDFTAASQKASNIALALKKEQKAYNNMYDKPIKDAQKVSDETFAMSRAMHQVGLLSGTNKQIFTKNYEILKKTFASDVQKGFITKTQLINEGLKRTRAELGAGRMQFQGWALSIMFAGMAVKNAMMQIWTSTSKTFQDVMHSTEGTVTGFDLLDGSMKYLGFTIGQALEPVAAWLAPIIQGFADWIANGDILGVSVQKILTWLIPVLAVVGGIIMAIGFWTLAVSGLVEAYTKTVALLKILQGLGLAKFFTGLGTWITTATTATWAWATATWAAIAPYAALVSLVLLAIALGISLGATWKQVLTGWILKFKLVWSEGQYYMAAFMKWALQTFQPVFDGLFDGFIWGFNLVIDAINAAINLAKKIPLAPKWIKELESLDKVTFSGKDMSETLLIGLDEVLLSQAKTSAELMKQTTENEKEGANNLMTVWGDLKNKVFGGATPEKPNLISNDMFVGKETMFQLPATNTNSTVTNNTTYIQELSLVRDDKESEAAYADRILKALAARVK